MEVELKRTKVRKEKPQFRAAMNWTLRRLPVAGAFFLLSLARCFSVPSPYAVCCLAALLRAGMDPWGAGMGLAAGLMFRILWGLPLDIWQFAACAACVPLMRLPWKSDWTVTANAALLLLLRALPEMARAADARGVIVNLAGVLLGAASMPAMLRAAGIAARRFRELSEDDLLCVALPCLVMMAGAGCVSVFGVNIGYFLSGLSVLTLSWTLGVSAGILGGLGCGMALLLCGHSALTLVNLVLGGVMAGMARGKRRAGTAALYLLSAVTASYLITLSFQPALFFGDLAACALFVLAPEKWVSKTRRAFSRALWSRPRENAYTRLKMQRWVRAIDRMADELPRPRIAEKSTEEESQALADMLCDGCERAEKCWGEGYERTKAGMEALTRTAEGDGDQLDVINRYFSFCPRISRLPGILRRTEEDRQRRRQRVICAEYERDMLQTHLAALSEAAQRISLDGAVSEEENDWLRQTEEALRGLRFPGKTAFVKKTEGRMSVCLRCDTLALRPDINAALTEEIGLRLRARLRVTENRGGRILLEEEPLLRIVTGTATACAMPGDRREETATDNGDAVLVKELDEGRELIALSDGMGHGAGAQDESGKTLELLSLCLEAGYTRAQAMTAVNGSMLSATGGEKFATVDLCVVDLWTGETAMNKLGACQSFLIRGQKIEIIQGEALPLGIIERVTPMEHRFTLGEGDTLLLLTDGIADALGEDEDVMALLRTQSAATPQQVADALLRQALIRSGGMPQDDMTALCARVEERKRRRKEE